MKQNQQQNTYLANEEKKDKEKKKKVLTFAKIPQRMSQANKI